MSSLYGTWQLTGWLTGWPTGWLAGMALRQQCLNCQLPATSATSFPSAQSARTPPPPATSSTLTGIRLATISTRRLLTKAPCWAKSPS